MISFLQLELRGNPGDWVEIQTGLSLSANDGDFGALDSRYLSHSGNDLGTALLHRLARSV